ncbi:MAG: hypothetical protein WCV79_01325 [Candidatus Paceibacterota bacterium]|jgi:hypothetical protein
MNADTSQGICNIDTELAMLSPELIAAYEKNRLPKLRGLHDLNEEYKEAEHLLSGNHFFIFIWVIVIEVVVTCGVARYSDLLLAILVLVISVLLDWTFVVGLSKRCTTARELVLRNGALLQEFKNAVWAVCPNRAEIPEQITAVWVKQNLVRLATEIADKRGSLRVTHALHSDESLAAGDQAGILRTTEYDFTKTWDAATVFGVVYHNELERYVGSSKLRTVLVKK